MTTTAIKDIKTYEFTERDTILLDANILLSVYGPNANKEQYTYIYSDALARMRTNKANIFVDTLVISEFVNRFARWAYDQLPFETKPLNFKVFRRSEEFKKVAQEIADDTRRIIEYATLCDSEFGSIDMNKLLLEYELGNSDFNDQVIKHLCKKRCFILATHDGDFDSVDFDILTANTRLLK